MNEIVTTQTSLFLISIEIGIVLGMLYDLIRIFRKIIKHVVWLVQIEDIVYWISCAFIGFGILYVHNYSQIRFFVFIGMALGALFYFCTFSLLFMKIATWLIEVVKKIIRYIVNLISIPIKLFIKLIKIPIRGILGLLNLVQAYQKMKIREFKRKLYYKQSDFKVFLKLKK